MWLADLHDQVTRVQMGQAVSECRIRGMSLDIRSVRTRSHGLVVVWQENEAVRAVAASRFDESCSSCAEMWARGLCLKSEQRTLSSSCSNLRFLSEAIPLRRR